jgi:hypothetical protein
VALSWPLQVGCRELVPVQGWGGPNTVHLAEQPPVDGDGALEAVPDAADPDGVASLRSVQGLGDRGAPAVRLSQTRTLCGRISGPMVAGSVLDLFGEHRRLVCGSCWRIVEGWLQPPPPAVGENDVVDWIVVTVLEIGEAMIDGVPVPRLEWVRRRTRSELKDAIGGSVRTSKVGQNTLWVSSGLVVDAKTPERWQAELRAAMERVSAVEDGRPVEPVRWRRHWSEITGTE